MTALTRSITIAITIAVATGCRGAKPSAADVASRVTVSVCPPGVAPATPKDEPPPATLTVNMVTEPAVAAGTELNLRLDGETTRSSIRVDATQPSLFTLAKGVYVVRVSLPGYTGVEGRATLTAGCTATMTLVLRRPTK
jgi:hypothetical protein